MGTKEALLTLTKRRKEACSYFTSLINQTKSQIRLHNKCSLVNRNDFLVNNTRRPRLNELIWRADLKLYKYEIE